MLITESYRQQNNALHSMPEYGTMGKYHAKGILRMINQVGAKTFLDYGCGKGTLVEELQKLSNDLPLIQMYDPAIYEYSAPAHPADFVACTDVLEHIEPECLDEVLKDIARVTNKIGYLSVAHRAALKVLPDGRNAHLIQEPFAWWKEKIAGLFEIIDESESTKTSIFIVKKK